MCVCVCVLLPTELKFRFPQSNGSQKAAHFDVSLFSQQVWQQVLYPFHQAADEMKKGQVNVPKVRPIQVKGR